MIKSFSQIPGPKSYPVVGTLLNYLPVFGEFRFDKLHVNGLKKYRKYGPIVREEIVPKTNIVWIFSPKDIQELFKKEGRFPQRRSHLALDHYRLQRKHLYNSGGLLPTNGEKWCKLRKCFQKNLSSPKNVKNFLPSVNAIIDEFIDYLRKFPRSGEKDFLPLLSRVYLEMLGVIAFDVRLHSFSSEELKPSSRSSELMKAALDINSCILKTDNGLRLWKYFPTPAYRKLERAHEYLESNDQYQLISVDVSETYSDFYDIDSVAVDLVKRKMMKEKKHVEKELSLLEAYLSDPNIDFKDLVGMTSDMLLAGIDTITYTTSFALYHLASAKEKQENLFRESQILLPSLTSPITSRVLAEAEYLKASLKESYRLNPVSVGIGRILPEDAVFSGFFVPKGTIVVTQNQVVCRLEEYFGQPMEFKPERWLKNNKETKNINPYLVLPFGHGPRTCIARHLAEQNMQALTLKICRNFKLSYNGGILNSISHLINKPDGPLKLSLKKREF